MRWLLTLSCIFFLGCDFGDKPEEPEEAVDPTEETDETMPGDDGIVGCDWLPGTWDLTDCANATVRLYITTMGECTVQVVANHPNFSGAWGKANDNALGLFLPAGGMQCQASFDGTVLRGACGTLYGPCAIEAVPVTAEE